MKSINKVRVYKSLKKKRGRPKKDYEDPDLKKIANIQVQRTKFYNPTEVKRGREKLRYYDDLSETNIMKNMGFINENNLNNFSCKICGQPISDEDDFKFRYMSIADQKKIEKMKKKKCYIRPSFVRPDGKAFIVCKHHPYDFVAKVSLNHIQNKLSQYISD